MYLTRSTAKRLNIDIHISFEEGGAYRLNMPSLTGNGVHTKWYYPERLRGRQGGREEFKDVHSTTNRPSNTPSGCSFRDGSLSAAPIYEAKLEPEGMYTVDHVCNGWDDDVRSDATELVDEEAEREAWLKYSKEEPLPDLPYERIMRRIAREPTVIVDEDNSEGTCSFEI